MTNLTSALWYIQIVIAEFNIKSNNLLWFDANHKLFNYFLSVEHNSLSKLDRESRKSSYNGGLFR